MTPTSLGRRVLLFTEVCLYLLSLRASGRGFAESVMEGFSPLGEGFWVKALVGTVVAFCAAVSLAVLALVDFALMHFVLSKRRTRERWRTLPQRA